LCVIFFKWEKQKFLIWNETFISHDTDDKSSENCLTLDSNSLNRRQHYIEIIFIRYSYIIYIK
jgi:hypothetical protein